MFTARQRHIRQLGRHRFGAYGITAALGIFGMSASLNQCAPATPAAAPLAPKAGVSGPINVAADLLARVNTERTSRGFKALTTSATLQKAAQDQSTYQANNKLMTHTGLGGTNCGARITKLGYAWRTWGENVAAGQPDSASVMGAWMNSAGHKANILNPAVTQIGVAAVKGANGVIYWTMDLAAPK